MPRLRLGRTDWERSGLYAAGLLLAAVILIGIAITVLGTPAFDVAIAHWAARQRENEVFWIAVTQWGGGEVRAAIGLIAAGLLWLRKRGGDALILLSVTLIQTGANSALKALFGRMRPDLYAHLDSTFDLSFPSGHSAQNAALYLLIAFLIDRRLLWIAVPLVLLIGASRIILGVHWPTDVLAGWMEGAAFALLGLHFSKGLVANRKA